MHCASSLRPSLLPRRLLGLAVWLLLGLPSLARADELFVPADYPTIQAAVNAALRGDTITLADGTYSGDGNRDIDLGGKSLTIQSASGDPAKTVIDCGGSSSANHRGFSMSGGELNVTLSGLTIENGFVGAGGLGGGVSNASRTGLFTVTHCAFVNNTASGGRGGGLYSDEGSELIVTNCTFTGNAVGSGQGGGLYDTGGGNYNLVNCTFTGNSADGGQGGGVYNDLATGGLSVDNCAFVNNTASGGQGGGLYNADGGAMDVTDCVFTGNAVGSGQGGGLYNAGSGSGSGTLLVVACTLTGNSANSGGGLYDTNLSSAPITLTDDILYGDTGGEIISDGSSTSPTTATYCDVQGGYAGTGNIAADPLFVNAPTDLHLQTVSPALHAGTFAFDVPATDKDGHPRPNPPSIGAYEVTAGHTHLLWTSANGTAAIWTLDRAGNVTSTPALGPIPGWTARTIADGNDGKTRLLWTRQDGRNAVWTVNDADGSVTSTPGYGPYDNGRWTVASLAVGLDNRTRLLWKHSPDGRSSVWTIAADGSITSTLAYGPYGPWTASGLAVGSDGLSRLLWGNGSDDFSFWTLGVSGSITSSPSLSRIDGQSASAIASGPDTNVRILVNRSDGAASVQTFSPQGNPFSEIPYFYGPIPGWNAHGLAVGPDATAYLLWSRADGESAVWTILSDGGAVSTPGYGPYPGWSATAISAGP